MSSTSHAPRGPIYEVVSGQILLSRRQDFFRLHKGTLLPIMREIGIRPIVLLFTEVGRYGRFLDIYEYEDFADYQEKTDRLLAHERMESYYAEVGTCVDGSIMVELMRDLPYAPQWKEHEHVVRTNTLSDRRHDTSATRDIL